MVNCFGFCLHFYIIARYQSKVKISIQTGLFYLCCAVLVFIHSNLT